MGLFSKKSKTPDYDPADCAVKKQQMRKIFDSTAHMGDTYEILYANEAVLKLEDGLVYDPKNTDSTILGFRRKDLRLTTVTVDSELEDHDMFESQVCLEDVVNAYYDPQERLVYLQYKRNYGRLGEIYYIGGTDKKAKNGPKNIQQPEEIEKFLDFIEAFREELEQKGYKLDEWKRG